MLVDRSVFRSIVKMFALSVFPFEAWQTGNSCVGGTMWRVHNRESTHQGAIRSSPEEFLEKSPVKGPHGLWIRYPTDLEAYCYGLGPNMPHLWTGQVRVLWVDGCCLSSQESISAGCELWCRIQCRGRSLTKLIRMHVYEVTREETDGWFASCAFDHSLTHKDCCVLL
jgi:hypothetical protein